MARAQQLAIYVRTRADQNADWQLPELVRELSEAVQGRTGALTEADDALVTPAWANFPDDYAQSQGDGMGPSLCHGG